MLPPPPAEKEKPAFEERLFSEKLGCAYDGTVIDDLQPRSFSFNSPHAPAKPAPVLDSA